MIIKNLLLTFFLAHIINFVMYKLIFKYLNKAFQFGKYIFKLTEHPTLQFNSSIKLFLENLK